MNHVRKPAHRRPNSTSMRINPVEEALVRTIHRKVGGPSKLSTYDDPAEVRDVVLRELANQQPTAADRDRINRGDLTPLERRVVRTVTNRGAAVRSRMRQRKELQRLREEIAVKDAQLQYLQSLLSSCCKYAFISSLQGAGSKVELKMQPFSIAKAERELEPEPVATGSDGSANYGRESTDEDESGDCSSTSSHAAVPATSCAASSMDSLPGFSRDSGLPNSSLDAQILSNIIDPLS